MKTYEVEEANKVVLETDDCSEAWQLCNKLNEEHTFNHRDAFVRHNLTASSNSLTITPDLEAYRFWFKGGGYAFYYLDHQTGVFQIYSDWGNYSYSWPSVCCAKGEKSLLNFIRTADKWYLTGKLAMNSKKQKTFNLKKSTAHVHYQICEERRRDHIDADVARSLWDWVGDFKYHELDHDREFYQHLQDNHLFCDSVCSVHDLLEYDINPDVLFLQESLIPFFHCFLEEHIPCQNV